MGHPLSRRAFLGNAALVTGGAILLSACGPDKNPTAANTTGNGLPPIEGGTVITDPTKWPTKFNESPEFAALVQQGKLPPVAERIGQDPLVIKPVHSIGTYGGVLHRGYKDVADRQNADRFLAGPDNLLWWDFKKEHIVPNIARGYEVSSDGKELTLHLRRGMRWSDGHPFTADDIIFWRNDVNLDPDLGGGTTYLQIKTPDGQIQNVTIEKVDDLTVRFVSPLANHLLPNVIAGYNDLGGLAMQGQFGGGGYAPMHYLSQFMPKFIGEAKALQLAKEAGEKTWQDHVLKMNTWQFNTSLPMLTPWIPTRVISDPPWEFTANPYSIWVDSQGNQLPYIPKISMAAAGTADVINLKAISGEYDFQDRSLLLTSLQVLLKNQQKGNYTIHKCPGTQIDFGWYFNLAYDHDPVVGDLLRTTDFRRALSLGIDRDAINQTFFFGTSIPTSPCCSDSSAYFPGQEYRNKWATLDVAQANQLLDKLGLDKKDSDGWRLRPDGKRLELETEAADTFFDGPGINEMIKRQYQKIGIYLLPITTNDSDDSRTLANLSVITGIQVGSEDPFLSPDGFLMTTDGPAGGEVGIPYAQWYITGGKQGKPIPDSLKPMRDMMDKYYQGLTAPDDERIRLGKEIMATYTDEVYAVGMLGFGLSTYGFYLAKNTLKNVPARILGDPDVKVPSNVMPMAFYY